MNKNCDTELAIARIADVPLRDLGSGHGYDYNSASGYDYNSASGYRLKGNGYGNGSTYRTSCGDGWGLPLIPRRRHGDGKGTGEDENGVPYSYGDGDGNSAPHEA